MTLAVAACESGSTEPDTMFLTPPGKDLPADPDDGLDDFGDDLTDDDGSSCVDVVVQPEQIPVNMFITVDKSSSMADDQKWVKTKSAFVSFFTAAEAASLDVAMRFWPDGACDLSCDMNACSQPQVSMGPLAETSHVQALVDLFNAKSPDGLTPMEAALGGAEAFALAHHAGAEAGTRTVVVFVTDGEPTACSEDIQTIAAYASDAYDAAGILTFAVGLEGSSEAQMNTIAAAGATGQGYFIGSSGDTESQLLSALRDIQREAVACTFAMPESDDPNTPVDPSKINVTYGDPNDPVVIPQVADEGACGPDGGWYYDDPGSPDGIVLCASTCDGLYATDQGQLQIALGCSTVVL